MKVRAAPGVLLPAPLFSCRRCGAGSASATRGASCAVADFWQAIDSWVRHADVVELVDTPDLGSGTSRCPGSSPGVGMVWALARYATADVASPDLLRGPGAARRPIHRRPIHRGASIEGHPSRGIHRGASIGGHPSAAGRPGSTRIQAFPGCGCMEAPSALSPCPADRVA